MSKEIMNKEPQKKRKAGYASASQTRRLIELLDADPELRSGKFSAQFSFKTAQKRWCEISDELNAIGGAHKTWSEWRKTYHDKKTKTKRKASAQNRSARQTGGGDPGDELNDVEKLLLGSISGAQISGHSDSHESVVVFKDLTNQMPSQSTAKPHLLEDIIFSHNLNNIPQIALVEEISLTEDTECLESGHQSENFEKNKADLTEDTECLESGHQSENFEKNKAEKKGAQSRKSKLQKSLEAASELQRALKEKNKIKTEYYKNKIEQMKRQADALEAIAKSIASRASPYI